MRWSFLLQLSDNFWGDEYEQRIYWHLPKHRFCNENKVSIRLWDEMVDFIAQCGYNTLIIDIGDGLKYTSHPEIAAPDAWSGELLKEKLEILRQKGIEPVPLLNFSSRRCAWMRQYSRMVGSSEFHRVCADLIREVSALFGNHGLFHLGLDGESAAEPLAQGVLSLRSDAVFWQDVTQLFDCCRENGMQPWIWADKYLADPESFVRNVPKDVMVSNRFYEGYGSYPAGSANEKAIRAFQELEKSGYEQILTCSSSRFGFADCNPLQTLHHAKQALGKEPAGFLTVPHSPTHDINEYYLKNDAYTLLCARQQVYPETLK